jgi:CTP:molybdopterin cytidylyltransferase MocA
LSNNIAIVLKRKNSLSHLDPSGLAVEDAACGRVEGVVSVACEEARQGMSTSLRAALGNPEHRR